MHIKIFYFAIIIIATTALLPRGAAVFQTMLNDTVLRGDTVSQKTLQSQNSADDPYTFNRVDVDPQPRDDVGKFLRYPPEALRAALQGRVYLRFKISARGVVQRVIIEKSTNPIFDRAAIDAMKQCRFTPAKKNGKPVAVWMSQEVNFKLQR